MVSVAPGTDTPMRAGDEVLRVRDRGVRNAAEWAARVAEQRTGVSYDVTFRSSADGKEQKCTMRGGRPTGVAVVTVFPSR